jgi:hypothetical protein
MLLLYYLPYLEPHVGELQGAEVAQGLGAATITYAVTQQVAQVLSPGLDLNVNSMQRVEDSYEFEIMDHTWLGITYNVVRQRDLGVSAVVAVEADTFADTSDFIANRWLTQQHG